MQMSKHFFKSDFRQTNVQMLWVSITLEIQECEASYKLIEHQDCSGPEQELDGLSNESQRSWGNYQSLAQRSTQVEDSLCPRSFHVHPAASGLVPCRHLLYIMQSSQHTRCMSNHTAKGIPLWLDYFQHYYWIQIDQGARACRLSDGQEKLFRHKEMKYREMNTQGNGSMFTAAKFWCEMPNDKGPDSQGPLKFWRTILLNDNNILQSRFLPHL